MSCVNYYLNSRRHTPQLCTHEKRFGIEDPGGWWNIHSPRFRLLTLPLSLFLSLSCSSPPGASRLLRRTCADPPPAELRYTACRVGRRSGVARRQPRHCADSRTPRVASGTVCFVRGTRSRNRKSPRSPRSYCSGC